MRKLILIAAALAAPIAVWTAGCRDNSRQSAFPNGPEVKNLARRPAQRGESPTAPMIAAAKIDPEVLHTPDQSIDDRLRAVMDKEAMLASRHNGPGLFVTPGGMPEFAQPEYVQDIQPMPVLAAAPISVPSPAPTNFWSRPAAPLPETPSYGTMQYGDVSAMAAPAPLAQPASAPALDPIMLPEAIPGVYMGVEAPVEGTASFLDQDWSNGWIGMADDAGALAVPPLLADSGIESVSIEDLNIIMQETVGYRPPTDAEIKNLLAPPQPSALAEGSAAYGAPKQWRKTQSGAGTTDNDVRQALLPLPDLTELLVRDMSEPMDKAFASSMPEAPALSIPEEAQKSIIDNLPKELLALIPPPLSESVSVKDEDIAKKDKELYLTDLWQDGPAKSQTTQTKPKPADVPAATASILDDEPLSLSKMAESFGSDPMPIALPPPEEFQSKAESKKMLEVSELLPLPELEQPGKSTKSATQLPTKATSSDMDADMPQKINLVPLRPLLDKPYHQAAALMNRIDSEVEAPPLRF